LTAAGSGLFLLSAASLAFEVTLTHLFSVIYQYHFAFLAVSIAILGLGVGAVLSYRLAAPRGDELAQWSSLTASVFAVALSLAVILFSLTGFVPGLIWQALLGAAPFVVVGLLTARLYSNYSENAAWLYAFDLCGAAAGLAGVLLFLNLMSAASVGFILGGAAALAALVFNRNNRQNLIFPGIALGLAALGLVLNLSTHFFDLPKVLAGSVPPDKTMFHILADPASNGQLVDSAWSSFARVDLVASSDQDQMYAFTNAGAGSYMIRFDGDLDKVHWLVDQIEYLPFANFTPQKTLILGSGAGKDVLQALLAGSQQVTAVEINPAMVALTRKHADYNGNILDFPGVQTVVADGRDYVASSPDSYDMIYLNLVYAQAPTPGSNALSESYIFTTEALREYWQHLSPNGRLAIISHQGLEGSRALITAIKALNLEGISAAEALKHSVLLMYDSGDPNQNATVMILQKSPLTVDQVTNLGQAGQALGMTPLFLPGKFELLFRGLSTDEITLDEFLVPDNYNLFPTSDESPFFFNLIPGLPRPLVILLVASGIVLILYLLSMIGSKSRPGVLHLVFFAGLGLGYVLVEVPLMQRALLILGSPTTAMVVVLASLLLSGGVGSLISSRWKLENLRQRVLIAALLVAVLATGLALGQPRLVSALESLSAAARVLLTGLLLVPLGLAMGIPFGNGLRLVRVNAENNVPFLWGWNAVTSVMGAALAASIAIWLNFGAVMLIGAACYVMVAAATWLQAKTG
jgi:hypothetical protein